MDLTKATNEEICTLRDLIIEGLDRCLIETLEPDDLDDLKILIDMSNDPGISRTNKEAARNRYITLD